MKEELLLILAAVETRRYTKGETIHTLMEYGFELTGWIARTGQLMSEAKEQLHHARRKAYEAAKDTLQDKQRKYSPLLLKDYINDKCAVENSLYELADRTNRACTHANGLIVTAISALKTEMQYQGIA